MRLINMITKSEEYRNKLNNATPHQVIEVPSGVYDIYDCHIKVPITLVGGSRTIFKNRNDNPQKRAFRFRGQGYFHCENINFLNYHNAIELYPGYQNGAGDSDFINLENCTFNNCHTAILGGYSSDSNKIGGINRLLIKNLRVTNSRGYGIFIICRYKYALLSDIYVDGASQSAIVMGVPVPRSSNPDKEFGNVVISRCDIRNVTDERKVQALLLRGRSIRVVDTHFENNIVIPTSSSAPVGHTSSYASIYTKGKQILISGCDFHNSAGVMIKKTADPHISQAIITNNMFNSDIDPLYNEANQWGVQAVSCTTGQLTVAHNKVFGMEVVLGRFTRRSIVKDNLFRETPITKHWGNKGRTAITHHSVCEHFHDIKENDFDLTSDNPIYWHPLE